MSFIQIIYQTKKSDRQGNKRVSLDQDRIVISKDSDFLDSHLIIVWKKFLYISTGNILNRDLIRLMTQNLTKISELFMEYDLIELNNVELIVHEK